MTVEELKVILELETKGFKNQAESAKKSLGDVEKQATSLKDRLKNIFNRMSDPAKKATQEVAAEANRAQSAIQQSAETSAKGFAKLGQAITQARNVMRTLRAVGLQARADAGLIVPTEQAIKYQQEIDACTEAIGILHEAMQSMDPDGESYQALAQEAASYEARIDELTQKIQSMPTFGLGGQFQDTGKISNIKTLKAEFEGLKSLVKGFAGESATILREAFSTTPVGKFAKVAGSGITTVKRFIIGAKNDLVSLGKGILNAGSRFLGFGKQAKSAGASVLSFIKKALGIGAVIALFNKMKSLVQEGMPDLGNYSDRTAKDLAILNGSLSQLKNSWAVAFAPILTVVAPMVQTLVNLITTACNALAMFFGALTGQSTVSIATSGLGDIAAGAASAADATGAANGAAQEYQRTLMGFDQINKLDDNKSSGGGGGGGVGGAGGFGTAEVANVYSGWAEKLKEAWANADFTDIGSMLAIKINEALAAIPWDKIRETCLRVATSIGTFINGFIRDFDWGQLASTISTALITVMDTVTAFVQTVDWAEIPRAILKFIEGIDWTGLFRSASGLLGSIAGGFLALITSALSEAWKKVKEYFRPYLEKDGISIVDGIFWGILDGIKNVGKWIIDNIFKPFLDGIKKAFGISSPAKKMKEPGQMILMGLLEGIKSKVGDLVKWFKDLPGLISKKVGTIVTNVQAKLSSWKDALKDKVVGFQSRLDTWRDNLQSKTVSFQAGLTSWRDQLGNKYLSFVANIKDKKDSLSYAQRQISIVGKVDKIIGKGGVVLEVKAGGGLYQNGSWKPITAAANGGNFSTGQLFVAREAGPELVGSIGGHTAVMNNSQIVASVSDGVYKAVLSAMSHQGGNTPITVTLEGDAQGLFRMVRAEARNYTNATGLSAFPV